MRFLATPLPGLLVVEVEVQCDARGSFGRSFCKSEFAAAGIAFDIEQANISSNQAAGTLRGMHYQAAPHGEAKLVRCSRGRMFDVAIDLRPDSPTRREWFGVELAATTPRLLYVPPGFAHGFLTLEADCEVSYLMGSGHAAEAARGVRWNDAAFGIAWPAAPQCMSERDAAYPDYLE
jgi:dTDP-4-dehydrorhamnose 3,5-epimerase